MIDRERWEDALKASDFEEAGSEGETAGFHIPPHACLVLHQHEDLSASLMRIVYEEVARDASELTGKAQQLEDYALQLQRTRQAEGGCLPLYASATPGGRLVANFCACSPFDETDEALATLHRFLSDNPLRLEDARL